MDSVGVCDGGGGEEEAVAKYVVGDTHAGVVVPPLSRYHIVSRTGQRNISSFSERFYTLSRLSWPNSQRGMVCKSKPCTSA